MHRERVLTRGARALAGVADAEGELRHAQSPNRGQPAPQTRKRRRSASFTILTTAHTTALQMGSNGRLRSTFTIQKGLGPLRLCQRLARVGAGPSRQRILRTDANDSATAPTCPRPSLPALPGVLVQAPSKDLLGGVRAPRTRRRLRRCFAKLEAIVQKRCVLNSHESRGCVRTHSRNASTRRDRNASVLGDRLHQDQISRTQASGRAPW
jgi:hypothetical protein